VIEWFQRDIWPFDERGRSNAGPSPGTARPEPSELRLSSVKRPSVQKLDREKRF